MDVDQKNTAVLSDAKVYCAQHSVVESDDAPDKEDSYIENA
jgi:hypothetical protein